MPYCPKPLCHALACLGLNNSQMRASASGDVGMHSRVGSKDFPAAPSQQPQPVTRSLFVSNTLINAPVTDTMLSSSSNRNSTVEQPPIKIKGIVLEEITEMEWV